MATENSERNTPKEVSLKLCLESLCYKSFMHKAVINTKKISTFVLAMQIASCDVFVYQRSEIANFKSVKVNEPGRLYFDVTCRFTLHWVFGDTSNVVSGSVTSI